MTDVWLLFTTVSQGPVTLPSTQQVLKKHLANEKYMCTYILLLVLRSHIFTAENIKGPLTFYFAELSHRRQSRVKIQEKPHVKQMKCCFCPASDWQLQASRRGCRGDQAGESAPSKDQTPLHPMHSIYIEAEIRYVGLIPCLRMGFTITIWVDQKIQGAWL